MRLLKSSGYFNFENAAYRQTEQLVQVDNSQLISFADN